MATALMILDAQRNMLGSQPVPVADVSHALEALVAQARLANALVASLWLTNLASTNSTTVRSHRFGCPPGNGQRWLDVGAEDGSAVPGL